MRIRINNTARKYVAKGSVADHYRFDADPDPVPTFHFAAYPDPDS
jgi:hypothetical protein